jgi:S-DNA-T family DNA segregation ATPase FtsK/SpoIIIE
VQVVLTRLAELNPTAYEGWSFSDLKTTLAHEGIEIGKSHGHSVVRADDSTRILTQRDDNDGRESGDDGGS